MSEQTVFVPINSVSDFNAVAELARREQRTLFCSGCGRPLDDEDLSFVHDVGYCPMCHIDIRALILG